MKTIQRPEAEVNELKNKLIKTLQDYYRSQVELWHQVPALAKEADRLKGHTSGRYQWAHFVGYWPISPTNFEGLHINLNTGELGPDHLFNEISLGGLDLIIERLDANEIISLLKNEIGALSVIT